MSNIGGFEWEIGGPVFLIPGGAPYDPEFQSGDIQFAGPNGNLAGSADLEFGQDVPNPGGVSGPFLLLGSGFGPGGSGHPRAFWIGTDQAFDANTPGNLLGITAGETQPSGVQPGGELFIIGGASFGGMGGLLQLQGGTSFNGAGGFAVLQGGNATNGGKPGDAFVSGGQNGGSYASVHVIFIDGKDGSKGFFRIRQASNPLFDFYSDGSIFIYNGGGFGTAGQKITSQGPGMPVMWS